MNNNDMKMHVRGQSIFIDDINAPGGLLHAVIFTSPIAKGIIKKLDVEKAKKADGVVAVFTGEDVPGTNQIGHIFQDQPLLTEKEIGHIGQPIALVVAETRRKASLALKFIEIEIEELKPIVDPREAYRLGELIQPTRTMTLGNVDECWDKCKTIVSGRVDSAGQEHFYLETQGSLTIPIEGGKLKVFASSQSPGGFHHGISEVLGMPMHMIEVDIRRLGGAFGGKESNATWCALSAMAAKLLNKPVKLVLSRSEDISTTGKRHPFTSDYKLGLDAEGKILAYEVMLYQNAGAFADISTPVLERAFTHAASTYKIPNAKITTACCRTNIVANGAFRGFGAPQSVFVIESAICKAAEELNVHPSVIQKRNLVVENDIMPYGMKLENCNAIRCWDELDNKCNIEERIRKVEKFNKKRIVTGHKKGIAIMPVCFGISFSQTALNQASSLVHVYLDGSVSVSTGAVEMGQGVNTKILLVAAREFSINSNRVKVETTNTSRVANASPTSASSGADLNGMATKIACGNILKRLKKVAAFSLNHPDYNDIEIIDEKVYILDIETDLTWEQLIHKAYWSRADLSSHAFYATPRLFFDRVKEKGRPFAYHSYGTSITEVTLDCIRGTYTLDSIDVVHDIGKSICPNIDKGQLEGGVIQGLGWSTIESLVFAENGKLLSTTNSYKVPDIKFIPKEVNISFLDNAENPYAVCNSKAVGEPPFLHGIGAYFAILYALKAAAKDLGLKNSKIPSLPITSEKAFMYLYG